MYKISDIDVKYLRAQGLGLSQEAFAQLIQVSSRTVARWESGETRPKGSDLRTLLQLAETVKSARGRTLLRKAVASGAASVGIASFLPIIASVVSPIGMLTGAGIASALSNFLSSIDDED